MIKIDVDDRALADALKKVYRRLQNNAPLMREIAGALKTRAQFNIRDGNSAEDEPFAELAEATIERRRKKRRWPGRILEVERHLGRSITTDSGRSYAQIGSNLVYARRQQLGDLVKPKKGPQLEARPYLPITSDGKLQKSAEGTVLGLVQNYLEKR
ncbi:MAG: phage virion morphogenesis protein [Wohlfahrtiimonas sp.]